MNTMSKRLSPVEVIDSCTSTVLLKHTIDLCCAGLCYLCVFFTWGALCVTKLGTSAGRARSLAVWGAVAAISTLLLIVQAAVQLLFFIGNDAWASDLRTKEILELVGCPKALSGLDLFLVNTAQHHLHFCTLLLPKEAWSVCRQAAIKAATISTLIGLARSKQDPITTPRCSIILPRRQPGPACMYPKPG